MTAKVHLPLAEVRLSQSNINEGMKCLFLFKTSTLEKLQPRFTPAPLRRGTLIAEGMAAARLAHFDGETSLESLQAAGRIKMIAKHDEWMKEPAVAPHLNEEMEEQFEKQLEACKLIFDRALEYTQLHEGRYETLTLKNGTPLIEHEMSLELPGFKEFGGKLDWVCRDTETGDEWLWDDKSLKRLPGEEYYETQLQAPAYQHLLNERHGLHLTGTINYLIRAHVPAVPEMNSKKSKGQSKPGMSRKKISTDWPTYRQALLDNGLNVNDYLDVKNSLSPFQRIDRYYRTPKEVKAAWENVRLVAQLLLNQQASDQWPRNLNPFNCQGCWLKTYCLADLRGHDTDFLAKTEYMREGEAPFFPIDIVDEDGE